MTATTQKLLAGFLVCMVAACKPPAPPTPTTQPAKGPPPAMVVVIPGLGDPNTDTLCAEVGRNFPEVNVVNFGTGKNSYLADVKGYILNNSHGKLVILNFSYGTDKANQVIGDVGPVALDIKLDPVPEQLGGEYTITPNVERTIVITGDWFPYCLIRAKINGTYDEYKVHADHVHIPGDARTWAIVIPAIKDAL